MISKNTEKQPPEAVAGIGARSAESSLWLDWIERRELAAREQLVAIHLPYARVVAASYYARRTHDEVEFDEYFQLASMGLLESFDRYDPLRGAQFRTFAARRMQGSILNGLARLTEKNQQIAVQSELRRERVRVAKSEALAKIDPSLSLDEDSQLPSKVKNPEQSLFSFLAEVGIGLALGVMLEGTGMIDAEAFDAGASGVSAEVSYFQQTELQRLRQTLKESVLRLNEQERTVIRYHYLQEIPFDDIGRMLGIKRSRVSQIHQQALRNLRQGLSRQACDVLA